MAKYRNVILGLPKQITMKGKGMATTVILEVRAKAGTGSDVHGALKEILPDTRAYDGCHGVDVFRNDDDADVIVVVEQWESRPHYEKYLAWRMETGLLAQLAEALDGDPSIRYFSKTDA